MELIRVAALRLPLCLKNTIDGKLWGFETVVMTLTGDIDLRQVSKITNQMDIPGGEQLKKAGKIALVGVATGKLLFF